ncbi:DUF1292 domain-containing protein [Bariatricus massiliensis]|uniref:DUF1292 domain-containing protein n=1 Tax=Bariatricus massiliensis TaxID=1745713 RepID=A0ABS8DEG2_9FIRM|nr:DUF1292 domain-containing protein [Bariatricus massiliensis]MCB7303397.1 DUF1292 domain-containing protein [Bariatricus massiliensis]MCB7373529.1 DUF1292 domain-containing protein [Bariatricus massiliensis]MCB7386199.1 DUF1292 domain-containing protein [Bariatricus massiliensis]MCB7410361.1 DUF1292 domain-containing protein [Bariatricus massiliensis]MCQ5252355.1 DUF1292 domain-containing protein [Bariatricus massiliensis]
MEKEHCDCGCNEEHEHGHILTEGVVTLTLDDDEEVDCAIITTYEVNSKEYIVLLPLDENGENEEGDVWIYRFMRDTTGGNNHGIDAIEDDDEYEAAADAFDEWLDEQEFAEISDGEEE